MSAAFVPSCALSPRASGATLVAGLCASLLIHLGLGFGASAYFSRVWDGAAFAEHPVELVPELDPRALPEDHHQLGMQEAKSASINWLGVIENPERGDAPIAQVEQAEFTRQIGNAPVAVSPQPQAEPMPAAEDQLPIQQPTQEPEQSPISPDEMPDEMPDETPDETPDEPQPIAEPLAEPLTEQIKLEPDPDESAPITITPQPEPVEDPAQEPEAIEPAEHPVGPELVSVDPNPNPNPNPESNLSPSSQSASPKVAGKAGVVSKKESAASILKRAIKVDARTLHKPIVGKGLEIITVEPRFPASVRFTELPRNPVLMIQFDATGRVRKAYFLKEGKRVYDTGARGVDEPLMNAIYQWRAKGKQIEALDPKDPDSVVEISMRITFRKERDTP